MLEGLEVSTDKSGQETKKLRELAQLVAKGRTIHIILYDQAVSPHVYLSTDTNPRRAHKSRQIRHPTAPLPLPTLDPAGPRSGLTHDADGRNPAADGGEPGRGAGGREARSPAGDGAGAGGAGGEEQEAAGDDDGQAEQGGRVEEGAQGDGGGGEEGRGRGEEAVGEWAREGD